MVPSAAPTGLVGWLSQYGNVVLFFGQLVYFLAMIAIAFAAVYAALHFRRWIAYQMGEEPRAPRGEGERKVDIDEFVD